MEEDNRGLTRKICYSSASRGVVGVLCPGMEKFCFVFFLDEQHLLCVLRLPQLTFSRIYLMVLFLSLRMMCDK